MLTLNITDESGQLLFDRSGMNISDCFRGKLCSGYKIHISL